MNNAWVYFFYIFKNFPIITVLKQGRHSTACSKFVLGLLNFLFFGIWKFYLIRIENVVDNCIILYTSTVQMTLKLPFKMYRNKFFVNCEFLRRSPCVSNSPSLKSWDILSWNFSGVCISYNKACVPKFIRNSRIINIVPCNDWEMHCTKNINLVRLLLFQTKYCSLQKNLLIFPLETIDYVLVHSLYKYSFIR